MEKEFTDCIKDESFKKAVCFIRKNPVYDYIVYMSPNCWEALGKPDYFEGYEVRLDPIVTGEETMVAMKVLRAKEVGGISYD